MQNGLEKARSRKTTTQDAGAHAQGRADGGLQGSGCGEETWSDLRDIKR